MSIPPPSRPERARALWRLLEPVHAVTYFSPEPLRALKEAGYRGFWMGYFAGRAAPLGAASAELVRATFYNFSAEHVSRAVPDAWAYAPPGAALTARATGSVAALRRHLGDLAEDPALERAAGLALRAAQGAPLDARPLYAANRALPVPDEPLERLWHAATLLREHRGDGHVVALAAAGIDGRSSHVLHALATGTPADVYEQARRMGEQEWSQVLESFRHRGLVDAGGSLSGTGRRTKQGIEDVTDALAATAYADLGDDELDELAGALLPVARAVVASGDIPARTPMGLDLRDLAG